MRRECRGSYLQRGFDLEPRFLMFLGNAVLPMRYSGVSYRSMMAWSVSESIRPVASCVRVFVSRPAR